MSQDLEHGLAFDPAASYRQILLEIDRMVTMADHLVAASRTEGVPALATQSAGPAKR